MGRSKESHTAVCFVAWNWISSPVTIIPDGFGTHDGEGGWGLSLCLALIKSHGVRFDEVIIPAASFYRIAKGRSTDGDINRIVQQQWQMQMWPSYIIDFHSEAYGVYCIELNYPKKSC